MPTLDSSEQPTPASESTPRVRSDSTPVLVNAGLPVMEYQAGMTIGRYVIERLLARGGMAVIYLAHDPNTERQVAIKVMPYHFNFNEDLRARFQREARVIASLEHANIVPIYDFGQQTDQLYIVMRYMAGGSLSQRLARGPLSHAEILSIAEDIAAALDDVHKQGIIHRDLKPDNILFDQNGNAYLSDFGIVKIVQSNSLVTGTGIATGTPAYMSTEQIEAKIALDGRSDIYALTVVLFEMLTGQAPYNADTPIGLVAQHLFDPVPQVRAIKPDLSPVVQGVIERGMAKNRDERYPTAAMLVEDLERALNGQPITAMWEVQAIRARSVAGDVPVVEPSRRGVPGWAIPAGVLSIGAVALALFLAPSMLGAPAETTATLTPTVTATITPVGTKSISGSLPEVVVVTATPQDTSTPTPLPEASTTPALRPTSAAVPAVSSTEPPSATPEPTGGDSGGTDSGTSDGGTSGGSSSGGDDGSDDGGLLDTGLTGGDDGVLDTGLTGGLP